LEKYNDPRLTKTTRWIVINKVDLLMQEQLNKVIEKFSKSINKIFWISAVSGFGVNELCKNIVGYLGASNGEHEQ